MIGLLDTHTFTWADSEPGKLSPKAAAFIQDPTSIVMLSAASVWEIMIKLQLGKLTLSGPLPQVLAQQQANGIRILPVMLPHVLALASLPTPHKDPFDRMLVAQSNVEGAALVSADPIFAHYPVNVFW
jgi:PIN domain nuclease of toxin-antitoxin system